MNWYKKIAKVLLPTEKLDEDSFFWYEAIRLKDGRIIYGVVDNYLILFYQHHDVIKDVNNIESIGFLRGDGKYIIKFKGLFAQRYLAGSIREDWDNNIKLAGIWDWNKFVAYFGIGTILGYAALVGADGIPGVQRLFSKNPQTVIKEISRKKQDLDLDYQNEQIQQLHRFTPNQTNQFSSPLSPPESQPEKTQSTASESIENMIERHEGRRYKVYKDNMEIPTIGVGFNLRRNGANKALRSVGADLQQILKGVPLTDNQIDILFAQDIQTATQDAIQFLPNLKDYPGDIQNIVIDMAFNLGGKGLSKFVNFKKALIDKDYTGAARQMVNSKWYSQVGNRSKELVDLMLKNAK
jgi:lysozyme